MVFHDASMHKTVSKNLAIFYGFDFKHFIFAQTLYCTMWISKITAIRLRQKTATETAQYFYSIIVQTSRIHNLQ
jgi:hypothetical protein